MEEGGVRKGRVGRMGGVRKGGERKEVRMN